MSDLATITQVKTYGQLSGSTYDATLTQLVSAASRAIEGYCDRLFIAETGRVEYHNGPHGGSGNGMGQYISLQLYPLTTSPKVRFAYPCIEIGNGNSATYEATVAVDAGVMTLSRNGSDATLTLSSYATMSALATAIVNLSNGWTASVLNNYTNFPASRIRNSQGVLDALNDTASFELFEIAPHRIRNNPVTGTIYGAYYPCGFQSVEVTYSGGYSVVPDDVVAACSDLTMAMFRISNRQSAGMLKSEKLGDYSYDTFPVTDMAAVAGNLAMLSPTAAQLLAPHRRIRAL